MIAAVLLAGAGLFLAGHLVSAALAMARRGRRQAGSLIDPSARITLLRPVCGRESFDADTLGSSFGQDWPNHDVIFCAPDDADPAVPLVQGLIAAHPGIKARLLTGQDHVTGNPKVDNLLKGWAAAGSDWVCMADSNLLLPPDYLRTLAASWTKGTGLVSSPAWGDRPDGVWGRLECAFLNSNQARLQLTADSLGMGFAQGKTLFWNRAMLDRAGGLPALGGWLAEDVAATRLTRAQGLAVRLPPLPYPQPIGRRSFGQVWDRQVRWSRVRRDGFAVMFTVEFINGIVLPLILLAAGLALAGLSPIWLAAFVLAWFGTEAVLMRAMGWPAGWRDVAVLPLRDGLLPLIWVATFRQRGITWRGHAMATPASRDRQA